MKIIILTPVYNDWQSVYKLVEEINNLSLDQEFEISVLKNSGICLVDFWAEWCGPCKQIGPILEDIASDENNNITIAKINIDENPRVATDYGIRSIPTMLLFNNGELKDTKVGALPKQELNEWIKNNS